MIVIIRFPKPLRSAVQCAVFSLALLATSLSAHAAQDDAGAFLAEVLAQNPALHALQQVQVAAEAAIIPAAALDDPMLSYSLAPNSLNQPGLDTGYSIALSQKFPWPGKRAQRREAANQSAQAAQQALLLEQHDVLRQARLWLAQLQFLQAALRINQQQSQVLDQSLASARARLASAAGTSQAVLSARVQLSQRRLQRQDLQARLAHIQAALNTLRGQAATQTIELPQALAWSAVPQATVLENHPQIRLLQAQQAASGARVREAELAWRPDIQFSASYVATAPRQENRARVGVGLNLPLAGHKRRQQLARARAQQAQLDARMQQALLQLQNELSSAQATAQAARQSINLAQQEWLPSAHTNLQAAQSDYAAGRGGFSAISEAEEDLLQARLGLASARRDALQAQARLLWLQSDLPMTRILAGGAR